VLQDFTPEEATETLKQPTTAEQSDVSSGVIERRTPGGDVILRFNLDPVAEYLAAIRRLIDMRMKRAGPVEWNSYLSSLALTKGYPTEPEGYLTAFATCYRTYKHVVFPSDRRRLLWIPRALLSRRHSPPPRSRRAKS
jgi:hypothetical protein